MSESLNQPYSSERPTAPDFGVEQMLFGCIEAGGTKFVVGILSGGRSVIEEARFDTTSPEETIGSVVAWFKAAIKRNGPLEAMGIASFGPLELDREATNWGYITETTKPGWSQIDFAGLISRAFGIPIGFDTDVNGAAQAEARWGSARGQKTSIYLTVGTGIGGGAVANGKTLMGISHPEMGHLRTPRHRNDIDFAGVCPFHGDCIEGLASGPAILARWGAPLSDLPEDHPGHEIIAYYIAQLVICIQAIMEPGRIAIGGGVMQTPGLLERIRKEASRLGAGYFRGKVEEVLVRPGLGNQAGLVGALALAIEASTP